MLSGIFTVLYCTCHATWHFLDVWYFLHDYGRLARVVALHVFVRRKKSVGVRRLPYAPFPSISLVLVRVAERGIGRLT